MRGTTWLTLVLALTLTLTGCSTAQTIQEQWAVQRAVTTAAQAVVDGLNNRNLSHAVATYFATPSEGADPEELANLVDPLGNWVRQHLRDATRVQLVSFEVGPVQLEGNGDRATIHYRALFQRTLAGFVEAEVLAEGDIRLKKLSRGWVIAGGPPPQITLIAGLPTP